jgi:hypothetical protein
MDDASEKTLLDKALRLQHGLVSRATGGAFEVENGDHTYRRLRQELIDHTETRDDLPAFVQQSRSIEQFWNFIKREQSTYQGRRNFIWNEFRPLFDKLERKEKSPQKIETEIAAFDPTIIHQYWQRALDRISSDPEGAITLARTLVESTCKHILESKGATYSEKDDLPKLFYLALSSLKLAPNQQTDVLFRSLSGSIQKVISDLSVLRNKLGDSHGKSTSSAKPEKHHAQLAVNLAGSIANFLVASRESEADASHN